MGIKTRMWYKNDESDQGPWANADIDLRFVPREGEYIAITSNGPTYRVIGVMHDIKGDYEVVIFAVHDEMDFLGRPN